MLFAKLRQKENKNIQKWLSFTYVQFYCFCPKWWAMSRKVGSYYSGLVHFGYLLTEDSTSRESLYMCSINNFATSLKKNALSDSLHNDHLFSCFSGDWWLVLGAERCHHNVRWRSAPRRPSPLSRVCAEKGHTSVQNAAGPTTGSIGCDFVCK